MSTRVQTRNFRNKYAVEKTDKKFCGVCQKAGLSEREYTSHFTKSVPGPQGIVICPTILNNECSFCYKLGHFKSGCPVIIERDRIQKKTILEVKQESKPVVEKKTVTFSNSRGGFAALDDFSDDEAPVAMKRKFQPKTNEEWPALSTVAAKPANDKPSFASIAANPIPVKKVDTSRPNICGFTVLTKSGQEYVPTKEELKKEEPKKWDWGAESSDDEDEDEDYVDNSAW